MIELSLTVGTLVFRVQLGVDDDDDDTPEDRGEIGSTRIGEPGRPDYCGFALPSTSQD